MKNYSSSKYWRLYLAGILLLSYGCASAIFSDSGVPVIDLVRAETASGPVSNKLTTKKPNAPGPLVSRPENLLFEHNFTDPVSFKKGWHQGKGSWEVNNGRLKVASIPAERHHAEMARKQDYHNAIFEMSFRFEGAKMIGLWMNKSPGGKREHVCRVAVKPDALQIYSQTGMGPTTVNNLMGEKPLKLETGKTYTLLVELSGQELIAQLNTGDVVRGKSELIDVDKHSISVGAQGESASFYNLRLWSATKQR